MKLCTLFVDFVSVRSDTYISYNLRMKYMIYTHLEREFSKHRTLKENEKEANLGRALLELGTAIVVVGILAFFANALLGLN